jgi:hypothetical protein
MHNFSLGVGGSEVPAKYALFQKAQQSWPKEAEEREDANYLRAILIFFFAYCAYYSSWLVRVIWK